MEKRTVAFTYMILHLAKLHVITNISPSKEYNNLKDVYLDFNNSNNFSRAKCELFPFLVTIGNGQKEPLLKVFFPFVLKSEGFIQNDISEKLYKGTFDKIFSFENFILKIDANLFQGFKLSDLTINRVIAILNENNVIQDNFLPDENIIEKSINMSIDSINSNKISNSNLMALDRPTLTYWSKNNDTYKEFVKYYDYNGVLKEAYQDEKFEIESNLLFSILINNFPFTPIPVDDNADKINRLKTFIERYKSVRQQSQNIYKEISQ